MPAWFFALVQLVSGLQPHPDEQHTQDNRYKYQIEFVFDKENDNQDGCAYPECDDGGYPLDPQGLTGFRPL
jgi:hypothetical protein